MNKNGSFLIVLLITLGFTACSPKLTFSNSTVTPAATGSIDYKKDKNKNYVVTVDVRNLADPKQLTPAKNTYVVWMDTKESSSQKLGQLGVHSKSLKGILKATSVSQPSVVYITAEDNGDVGSPSGVTVLTTQK